MTEQILKGRYVIQRQLGARAGQQTLLALDQQTQESVVVKLLTFGGSLQWETFKLFEREAQTLQQLSHPAIPRYLDYFEVETPAGKGFALVQGYIPAPSLEEHLRAGRTFSEAEVKQLAKAVLEILVYLHNRYPPLIHRDIKPSNLLLEVTGDRLGAVYLVDFGSVQAAAIEKSTVTVVGTYGYMPPEQFGNRAVPASDLYGLGATLIHLASGQPPADLPQRDLRIEFDRFVSLSSDLKDWLRSLTEPSLERRLSSALAALDLLEHPRKMQPDLLTVSTLVRTQPSGSRVVLKRKESSLYIMLPPKGFSLELIPMIGFATVWNGFLLMWYAIAFHTWSSGGWFAAFFALGHLGVGLWITLGILFTLFGKIHLLLDQQHISLWYEIFGQKYYRPRPTLRNKIIRLEKTKTQYKRGSNGPDVAIKPVINIWAGTRKFSFGGNGVVSEVELEWLAYELSEWLDLPVVES